MASNATPNGRDSQGFPRFMLSYFGTLVYGLIWGAALLFTVIILIDRFDSGHYRDPSIGVVGLCILAGSLSIARAIRALR
jgi:hypothetical protein